MSGSGRAAPQIRYALSQLRSRNGHHEFEHLCRELARVRITPNILPATGPVSAGGDQGRDFETFRTCIQERLPDTFLAAEGDLRIVFACTLQRENLATKIRNDLGAIAGSGPVDRVYFFCEQDIPVARRHQLCDWARETYGADVEIIDGQALSELLAAEDCRWIAERYLGVEVSDRSGTPSPSGTSSGLFGGFTRTGIRAGVIHGDVNIYHAGPRAAASPDAEYRRRRPPAPPNRSRKRWLRTTACLIAVAGAVAPVLILAPWRHSPPQSPATILDEIAAREWTGTVSFDRTLLSGGEFSVSVALSVDPSPPGKPGDRVGFISYGQGCPRAPVTLIRNDPGVLTLTDAPLGGSALPSCRGNAGAAFYLSNLRPAISITVAGAGPQAGISVLAATAKSGTIYRGTLHTSN